MFNYWVSQKEPMVTWVADLSGIYHDAKILQKWLYEVLQAGEEFQVYSVHEAASIQYSRNENGSLIDLIGQQFDFSKTLDLFYFANHNTLNHEQSHYSVFAQIAYYDLKGKLTESEVKDIGSLLCLLRPLDASTAYGLMYGWPAVYISNGLKINFQNLDYSTWSSKPGKIQIKFALMTDIWFPWVLGFLEDTFDLKGRYDNRELAFQHTPRLNAFLSKICESTLQAGGIWRLDPESSRSNLGFMLNQKGINLKANLPEDLFLIR